jgi:DNA polymerase-1
MAPAAGAEAARRERLFLVDAMGLLFRAHFAFVGRPLTTSRGEPVGALFGFVTALISILRDEAARFVAVVLDSPPPTFRHERYPAYKANRPPLPAELATQLPLLSRVAEAMGLPTVARPGVEADDLIGSLAACALAEGWEAVIVSADKDFSQLLRPGVRQLVPARGREPARWVEAGNVATRWGVTPEQFCDYLALTGDSSDNIPGVTGVGPKTAAELLGRWLSLAGIYENLERVTPPGLRRKLAEGREAAELSRELAQIRVDLLRADPRGFDASAATSRPEFRRLLRELEFRSLESRLFGAPPPLQESLLAAPAPDETVRAADGWGERYRTVTDEGALAGALEACDRAPGPLALDTETSELDARHAALVGVSVAWAPGEAAYFPVGHAAGPNLSLEALCAALGPRLADEGVEKVGQNLAFDLPVLARHGLPVRGSLRDTMLASYVVNPEGRHGLDDLSAEWLGHRKIAIEELIGRGRSKISMAQLRPERVGPYACEDADAAGRLWGPLARRLDEVGGRRLFDEVEMPLVPVLIEMREAGIALDPRVLEEMGLTLAAEMARVEAGIHRLAGGAFNVNSPRQLQTVLFERLRLPSRRRTKTGLSTDQEVLEELAVEHPLPRAVLEYRQLAKLRTTYVEALPRLVDPRTGRLHTQFHQAVTATGRLSSSDPNLQNIPVRTPQGREIRKAFVAAPGHALVSADYSQIELRLLAHLSEDEHLCHAFAAGDDVHRATAARVFGVAESEVTPLMRGRAKTINFGVIYGMGAPRLGRELGIPVREAARFIEAYFARLPGVKAYVGECVARARAAGHSETLLGRRRYLPDLGSAHARERAAAERMALNATIQGSAADLIKVAMIGLREMLDRRHPGARLVLQVHDELLLEVPEAEVDRTMETVREAMESVQALRVPLRVDLGCGRTWFDAHA